MVKKFAAIALILLGFVEILYGILWGRLGIYAHEAPFALSLKLSELSDDQVHAFNHYLRLFKEQWYIVAVFGLVTVIIGGALLFADRKKKTNLTDQPK